MKKIFIGCFVLYLSGCATTVEPPPSEAMSGYTYVPVDPFSVKTNPGTSCGIPDSVTEESSVEVSQIPYGELLESLPDNAVRTMMETFYANGSVSYGPSKISADASSYRLTVDYINADTTNVDLWIKRTAEIYETKEREVVNLFSANNGKYTYGTDIYEVTRSFPAKEDLINFQYFNLPVYVGVGLRVTADINDVNAAANISGLGSIGVEAEAGQLKGSLTVQTLGINGRAISAALPIQSELNRTTAQNAIVSIGSIKALLYEDDTVVQPRVVGIYLPFLGGKALVNGIISELSSKRVVWHRPCPPKKKKKHNKSN